MRGGRGGYVSLPRGALHQQPNLWPGGLPPPRREEPRRLNLACCAIPLGLLVLTLLLLALQAKSSGHPATLVLPLPLPLPVFSVFGVLTISGTGDASLQPQPGLTVDANTVAALAEEAAAAAQNGATTAILVSLRGAQDLGIAPALPVAPQCGPYEAEWDYITEHSYYIPSVPDMNTCCIRCQWMELCTAWTWVSDDGLMSSNKTQCFLKGGKFFAKIQNLTEKIALKNLTSGNATGRYMSTLPTSTYDFNYAAVHTGLTSNGYECPPQGNPPVLPQPAARNGAPAAVRVLTYNLGWWAVFDDAKPTEGHYFEDTPGNAATLLVAGNAPYDLMAFQECIDINFILRVANLPDYEGRQAPEEICLAFNRGVFDDLGSGFGYVGEDNPHAEYWRRRGAQWVRLRHRATGRTLLFLNHHGALPVNTGGVCGSVGTAYNLLAMMAEHAWPGDAIILAGDFNAGQDSDIIKQLQMQMVKAFGGVAYGGVDNIFSNLGPTATINSANLGLGGSDHAAITATLQL